jgi:hypothetical protein
LDLFVTDPIKTSSRFYKTISITVNELLKSGVISLELAPILLKEVAVLGYMTSGVDVNLKNHGLQVDLNNLGLLAGEVDADILLLLRSIPGIRNPDGKPGSLSMRGGTFDQNFIQFDGIPIYHPGHFFGTISPYNPLTVEHVEVQRGTLAAQYGGRVGGLININTFNSIPDSLVMKLSANTLYAGFGLKTPLFGKHLGLSIAARQQLPGGWQSPKLAAFSSLNFQGSKVSPDQISGPNNLDHFDIGFKDINAKLLMNISSKQKASVSFLNIQNDFGFELNSSNRDLFEQQKTSLDNWGLSGNWHYTYKEGVEYSSSVTYSKVEIAEKNLETENGNLRRDDVDINQLNDFRFDTYSSFSFNQNSFKVGYNFTNISATYLETDDGIATDRGRQSASNIHALYTQLGFNFENKLTGELGARLESYELASVFYLDPRLTLSYAFSPSIFLKFSMGRSHQYIIQELRTDFDDFRIGNQFWTLLNKDFPVVTGDQVMLGGVVDKWGWLFDMELYWKKSTGIRQQKISGELTSLGLDFFVRKKWKQHEAWVAYSLLKTNSSFTQINAIYYDQRHSLSVMYLLKIKKLSISTSWNLSSGTPVILPDPSEIEGGEPLISEYADRFPVQHQLDFSVSYTFSQSKKGFGGNLGLSLLNLYDKENVINIFQVNTKPESPYRLALGFAPNIQATIFF